MDKLEIEKSLRKKYDDEFTVTMFTNFVLEFQECFPHIMDSHEVINRIKQNICGNIIIKEELDNKKIDGQYNKDGYICIIKSVIKNKNYMRYLLFHEMLHAITAIRDKNGNEISMGFSKRIDGTGMGFNEAMTEYLTIIRNKKLKVDDADLISGYRPIVETLKKMFLIIGEKKLIDCYFYAPNILEDILNSNGMNYIELEKSFRNLSREEIEIYSLAHGKKLNEPIDYQLYRYAKNIFDNYSNAIVEVNTLEDFEKKYTILKPSSTCIVDPILMISVPFFESMRKDIDILIKHNYNISDVKNVLNKLNIDLKVMVGLSEFSKCFTEDKNQSAIAIYEYYKKNPRLYFEIFKRNYGLIFDHFSESCVNLNEENLYNSVKYPCFGALLKQHPEIDYCDVSYEHIIEKASGIDIFVFSTASSDEKYAYDIYGNEVKKYKDKDKNLTFLIANNENYKCYLTYTSNKTANWRFVSSSKYNINEHLKKVAFTRKFQYSEKEELEYYIENNQDTDGYLAEKLEIILNRINKNMKIK